MVFIKLGYRKIAQKGEGIAFPFFVRRFFLRRKNSAISGLLTLAHLAQAEYVVNLSLQLLAIA